MEPSEREWQQLWARLDLLGERLGDDRERLVRLEQQFIESAKDTADMRHAADIYQAQLLSIDKEITRYKAGWRVLVAIGTIVGGVIGWAVMFFRTAR